MRIKNFDNSCKKIEYETNVERQPNNIEDQKSS